MEEGVTCKPLPIVNRGMSAHVYHGTKARILSSCLFILPSTVLCDPLVSAWLLSCLQNSLGRRNPIFFYHSRWWESLEPSSESWQPLRGPRVTIEDTLLASEGGTGSLHTFPAAGVRKEDVCS